MSIFIRVILIDINVEHRKRIIFRAIDEVMEVLAQFEVFDVTV